MKTIAFNLQLKSVPPVARRGQHVLVLIQNSAGKYLLGGKIHYPTGIVRLLGGGMDQGENPDNAALREMEEELHIHLDPEQLQPVAKIVHTITVDSEVNPTIFTTYLYFAKLEADQHSYTANDDIDQVAELTQSEFENLITRFGQLPIAIQPGQKFAWADYGAIYGPIHQIALDFVRAQK